MESMFIYLAQSALISGGFLAIYHLFLKRDTFFTENRLFLLSGLVLSLTFPLIKIQRTIIATKPLIINSSAASQGNALINSAETAFTLENILLALYLLVSSIMMVRFILQLGSLKKLATHAKMWREHPYLHVETEKKITPFSFFNYLFYNPKLFSPTELNTVLAHEKVHARQFHSLDILLLELLKIAFWFNPVLWLYKPAIKQNLEFLADHHTLKSAESKKDYQYLMLKQAVDHQNFKLSNSFYNSLIKKRIVMLNQDQSKRISVFKTLLVLPLLGLFLVSFSIENVYQYTNGDSIESVLEDKSVELTIDKDTSNDELDKIKSDLAKDGIDFSYTAVRNDNREIVELSLQISGKNGKGEKFSGNYTTNSDGPIDPVAVLYDDDANLVSFGSMMHKKIKIRKMDSDKVHWTTDDNTEIVIRKDDSKRVVIRNGKQLSDDEIEEMEIEKGTAVFVTSDDEGEVSRKIKVKRLKKDGGHVMIIKDSDEDEDIEVMGNNGSFFFIDTDGGEEPLYYLDGKKVKAEEIKKLSPDTIKSMEVLKGDEAIEKYGKKAKDGVVVITTKKGD
ncbi:M56 family metallopeptidase [Flagellimonas sediminis]|uniref:M56 family peptidase n=1 Tax=Flagellimonas sediminis TaxID=2696468 RepID=A0A6I5KWD9_9FLAO|nr:M56 family metallopeptidase [Allomuricauda sediminis]NDV44315.1 M56 family peptidase [Allomuricauda sediminis]